MIRKNLTQNEINNRLLPDEISSYTGDLPVSVTDSCLYDNNPPKGNNNNPQFSISDIVLNNYSNSTLNITSTTIIPFCGNNNNNQGNVQRNVHQFKPITPDSLWVNAKCTFYYIKCNMITTFFYGAIGYSELTHPHLIEDDPRYELQFLYKGHNASCIGEGFILPHNFQLGKVKNEELTEFINALNTLGFDTKYCDYSRSYLKKKKKLNWVYGIVWFLLIGFICALIYLYMEKIVEWNDWLIDGLNVVGVIILICCLIFMHHKFQMMKVFLMEKQITYRIKHHNETYDFIETWNKNLFSKYRITMWVPVSLNYVMFNMSHHEDIEIISHRIEEIHHRKGK